MLQVTLLVLISVALAANSQCPGNWVSISGSSGYCYMYVNTPETWAQANTFCQAFPGGDLTSIDNQSEGTAIYNHWTTVDEDTARLESGYWIGLTDLRTRRRKKWTDWTTLRWTNWQTGQPSTNADDDCAYVANKGANGDRKQWRATTCDDISKPFFCERKLKIV